MKFFISLLFIFIFFFKNLTHASELICSFEEIYIDGTVQNGIIFLGDKKKLRYEYFDKSLYTIIFNNNKPFIIRNDNRSIYQALQNENEILDELIKLFNNEDLNLETFQNKDVQMKFEKSLEFEFYKRISINSNNINVSIYFYDCARTVFDNRYFNLNPFIEFRK